jgi:hypothetical protein
METISLAMITTRDLRQGRMQKIRRRHEAEALSIGIHDGEWAGDACFIIGGGASLKDFDFERLRGKGRIIVINRAYEHVPFADIHFFIDNRYYKRVQGEAAWQALRARRSI